MDLVFDFIPFPYHTHVCFLKENFRRLNVIKCCSKFLCRWRRFFCVLHKKKHSDKMIIKADLRSAVTETSLQKKRGMFSQTSEPQAPRHLHCRAEDLKERWTTWQQDHDDSQRHFDDTQYRAWCTGLSTASQQHGEKKNNPVWWNFI